MTERSDSELVRAARRGDVDGFGELCQRYYPGMVGVAYCALGDRHLAEDAAQEAIAVACGALGRLKRTEKVGSWLRSICRNVARRMARSRSRVVVANPLPEQPYEVPSDDTAQLVRRSIRRLSSGHREVIVLRYFSGLSQEEIAAMLGISPQAVNGRLTRAKRKLGDELRRNALGRRNS